MRFADSSGISAILLFGSRAREDNRRGSDTDLLLIAPANAPRHKSIGHLSMFFYPWEQLSEDARAGDLFVCHIVKEAKPVFDPEQQLERLRSQFRLRSNYAREIEHARELGWFLDRQAGQLNSHVVVRRMVWCVRTILIARLAERGTPQFSPEQLAASGPPSAVELLADRHQRKLDVAMRQRFRQFLNDDGSHPPLANDATIEDYREFFSRSDNRVALQTIQSGTSSGDSDDYR
jgi:predicted nucleotidyltransferase